MAGRPVAKCLVTLFLAFFAATSMGVAFCPPPNGDSIVSEKSADIYEYHFKDSA